MRPRKKPLTLALAGIVALLVTLTLSSTQVGAQATPLTPASYINPDTGKPTENPDVDPGSECETPDQTDDQPVVVDPMADNVHNDACLFDAGGARVDTQATFESSGVGTILACPDPDGMDLPGMEADDKTATLSDSDGDGGNDRCVLSGFEDANTEYHTRLVSDTAGTQTVNFCEDPEGDGCANAPSVDTITINWTADDQPDPDQPDPGQVPEGGVDTGVGPPPTSDFPLTATIAFSSAALLSVAALTTWFSRRRQWS